MLGRFTGPFVVALLSAGGVNAQPASNTFDAKIKPFLVKHCTACHNEQKNAAGVPLDHYMSEAHARKDRKVWEEAARVVAAGEMPPKKKPQPTKEEAAFFVDWVTNTLNKVDCTAPKDPGRVTVRRLNRAEYNNTVRDLCGVDFKPAEDFPSDDVGYGFDNIGDVLSVQPVLLEKYMAAADKILDTALVSLDGIRSSSQRLNATPPTLRVSPRSAVLRETNAKGREVTRTLFVEEGAAVKEKHYFPADGEYIFRVRAWGTSAEGAAPKLTIRVDGREVKSFDVTAAKDKPEVYEGRMTVKVGDLRLSAGFVNPSKDKKRSLGVEYIEVEGPVGGGSKPLPDSTRRILVSIPKTDADTTAAAEQVLKTFARRAYRRPVTADEVQRLMKLFALADAEGDPFEVAIKLPLKAILVSPSFLFRSEADPKDPNGVRDLTPHELASRLSYFLWSSMPDEELTRLADNGSLAQPAVRAAQVKRMLKDPKAAALTENFAGQWLMLRNIRSLTPDTGTFPTWDESLREAVTKETEKTFEYVVREDRSVLEFLDSDYTFVNDRLSWHYGIPDVKGREFRKVTFPDWMKGRRGGLVTHASILLVTGNPTRTSPVKRGKWVYENILGLTAPPVPPDVPELEQTMLKGTLRQRMEQHRENPSCAGCHAKLDPLGFGLENFDGIGKWRDKDEGHPIDASGVLPDGSRFSGPAELKKVLLAKSDLFRRCLAEKLLTFALGRGLDYYDKCTLDELVTKLKAGGDTFSSLAVAIVESEPFRKRKGKRSE